MVNFNTELLLPKKYYDGEFTPEGLIWHGMSAINAHDLGLSSEDPFDVGVNIAIIKSYNLSVHGMIDRKGNFYQLVPWSRKSRHAGVSLLNGRQGCNGWCVGIEVLTLFKTTKKHGPAYTEAQIKTGLEVQKWLMENFPIRHPNIAGHDEVRKAAILANIRAPGGSEPTSKPDPGKEFPWSLFRPVADGLDDLQKQALAERSEKWAKKLATADGS
jgi:N-acetyl-anhydromuramyl-L-alanine amidase AmpD